MAAAAFSGALQALKYVAIFMKPMRQLLHATIRRFIADTIPGYAQIGEIDQTKREFHIEGRIFHEPKFNTPGRALA